MTDKICPVVLKREYSINTKLKIIMDMIFRVGNITHAAGYIISAHTGRPLTYFGMKSLVKRAGYNLVMGPYLLDKDKNIIDIEEI